MAAGNAVAVKPSSPALVALAWLVVVAPTLWGFSFTVQNAMKLFQPPPAAAAKPAVAPVAPVAH